MIQNVIILLRLASESDKISARRFVDRVSHVVRRKVDRYLKYKFMEYVVIEIGGKQYRVGAGDIIEVDRITQDSDSISFDKILLAVNGEDVKIGKPYVDGANVSAKLLENFKGDKIRVGRFTAKSRHRRVIGFRPSLTRIQIEKINIGSKVSTSASKSTKKTAK